MDNVVVYYEAWQMQCCGEPFEKGDVVTLEVYIPTESANGNELGIDIDFYEDHHNCGKGYTIFRLTGQVERICAEYSLREDCEDSVIDYRKVKKHYLDCDCADGYNFPQRGIDVANWGYFVWLSNARLKSAEDEQ